MKVRPNYAIECLKKDKTWTFIFLNASIVDLGSAKLYENSLFQGSGAIQHRHFKRTHCKLCRCF